MTLNAVDPSRLPGGSSAGTATAVAGSLAVLGLAEETGGSIQNPASAQDLVGIKPTFALVPNAGVMPLAGSTRDVVGPIARCVRDAALTLDALAGVQLGRSEDCGQHRQQTERRLCGKSRRLVTAGKAPRSLWAGLAESAAVAGGCRSLSEGHRRIGKARRDASRGSFRGHRFLPISAARPKASTISIRAAWNASPMIWTFISNEWGPDVAIPSFEAFVKAVASEDPFAPKGVLFYMKDLPQLEAGYRRSSCAAGPFGVHRRQGSLSFDLQGGHGARKARWLGLPANARRAAAFGRPGDDPRNHSLRDQHRRSARRHRTRRLLRFRGAFLA